MEQKDIKKLKRVANYLEKSSTMQKLLEQYVMVITYEEKSYTVNRELGLEYKLYVIIEKDSDDAQHFNYLISCHNDKNYIQMIKDPLTLKRSEYNTHNEDDVIVKGLEKVCRLFRRDYD